MKLTKLPAEPGVMIGFFEEGLARLGAVCERSWHDRLEVLAEGPSARLWRDDGQLHNVELHFPASNDPGTRDATRQVFPGSPLTFRLVELLRQHTASQFRAVLSPPVDADKPPATAVAEKVWQHQFGRPIRLDPATWEQTWHFSLVATVRCEIQALDQHWSFHRLAIALTTGETDAALAAELHYQTVRSEPVPWPALPADQWQPPLARALTMDLTHELDEIKRRQQRYLERELRRLDDYFTHYEQELRARLDRQHKPESKLRFEQRLRAAELEHARRRADQIARHEIRVRPHLDALLVTAEGAWKTATQGRHGETLVEAVYVPRTRRWFV